MLMSILLIVTGWRNLSEATEKKMNAIRTRNQIRLFRIRFRNFIVINFFPLVLFY
jgi:hypothetical protein